MTTKEKILLENKAWVLEKLNLDSDYFKKLAVTQDPSILWIQSSDITLPVQELVNGEPGEILVYSNIATQIRDDDISLRAVLEDATMRASVKSIVVCGFSHCEGIQDVLLGVDDRPAVRHFLSNLRELYEENKEELLSLDFKAREKRLSELNIRLQIQKLSEMEHVQKSWKARNLPVLYGWYFDLETGYLKEIFTMEPHNELRQVASLV